MAIQSGGVVPSQMIRISLGPATMSMPTVPNTRRLAAATYALPGPTILSTWAIDAVPYASAPTAWSPPMDHIRSTPPRAAAASTMGLRTPSGVDVTMTTSPTPATLAGTAFMMTENG